MAAILFILFLFSLFAVFLSIFKPEKIISKNVTRKQAIIISSVFALIFFIGFGTASSSTNTPSKTVTEAPTSAPTTKSTAPSQPTATPKPTDTPTPTATPVPKDANGFPMDAEAVTVANLDKAPSQYEGKKVTFTCIVAGFAKDSSGNAAAVNCSDPNDYSSLVQVATSTFDMTKINPQDTVRFYGLGGGSASGKNAFGGTVSESLVEAIYINDITSGYKE